MDTSIAKLPVDLNNLKNQHPDSHKIHAYEYTEGTLYVQFKSNANKVTYAYPDVSAEEVAELDAAESKGKFFNRAFVEKHLVFTKLPGTTQAVTWPEKDKAA